MVSNLISKNPNNQLIVLHFHHANYSILFQPISGQTDEIQGKEYRNLTKAELKKAVAKEYGIDLMGFERIDGVTKLI